MSSLEINENLSEMRCASPYAVFVTKNPDDETSEHVFKRQEKFLTLSESVKDKLVSEETAQKIQTIGKNFNLELLQLTDIARAVRGYYFGEIQLENFPAILSKEMGVDQITAQKISELVIQRIINDDSQEKAYVAQLEKLPITIAIQKYPELGEQLITQNRIKLAVFPDPVRPSIKNWLADYSYVVGISNHDPIVRGNYLFKSENGRNLNSSDREKLAEILKSFEEKTLLIVNTKTKQIIFLPPTEKRSEKPLPTQQTSATNSVSPVFATDTDRLSAWRKNLPQKETLEKEPEVILPEKISFSSPQTFSTEKIDRTTPTLTRKYSPFPPQKQINSPQGRPMPKNVVNLREE